MLREALNSPIEFDIKENQDLVILVVSLLLSVACIYFVIGESQREILRMQYQIKESNKTVEQREKFLYDLTVFNEETSKLAEGTRTIKSLISNRNNYEDFLAHIYSVAKSNNLSMSTISVGGGVDAAKQDKTANTTNNTNNTNVATNQGNVLKKASVTFAVSGDFSSFVGFLNILENSSPFVQLETVAISTGGNTTGVGSVGDTAKLNVGAVDQYPILSYNLTLNYLYY